MNCLRRCSHPFARGLHRLAIVTTVATLAALPLAPLDAGEPIRVPDQITARHVPPLDSAVLNELRPYSNIRSAGLSDWHPNHRRMLINTRFAQTRQLHLLTGPGSTRRQITFFDEQITRGTFRPGSRKRDQIAFTRDVGGNENHQIFLLDLGDPQPRRLTDGVHRHHLGPWSPDGSRLTFVGNGRNGRDFDPYLVDPDQGQPRRLAELTGSWSIVDWSPAGDRLLLLNYVSINESTLHALDIESGELRLLTPRGDGEEATAWVGGQWASDGKIYTLNDRDHEFLRLVRIDPETLTVEPVTPGLEWDVEDFAVADDGKCLAYFVNQDGISQLRLIDPTTGKPLPSPSLPDGVGRSLLFRGGSHEIGFSMSWAHAPRDVYSWDPTAGRLDRWTRSETGGLDFTRMAVPELIRYPTFDQTQEGRQRTIPAFVYRPSASRGHKPPYPVFIQIHGGPESQIRPVFIGATNYWIEELGVALIRPNVRGSDGYGKSYLRLDNGFLREDSVRDIGALLDWIATQDDLDSSRVMVGGGSYGGYMVLASLTHYSDRLRGGSDMVGISNFVSFLENTQPYRRDLRRAEYGDERDPKMRAFLERISPANRVEQITKPLLVAQGANDPRVPLSESDQIVAALEDQGTPVWYVVAANEGHGFRKKVNADYLLALRLEFIRQVLLGEAETSSKDQPED